MRVLGFALLPLAWAPFADQATLGAQALANRIAAVGDGTARISFASRAGVCGDGRSLIVERLGGPGETRVYSTGDLSFVTTTDRLNARCDEGPVTVTLGVRDREVTTIRLRVAAPAAVAGERDLGMVSAPEAAAYLLALAERSGESVGRDAVLGASLADSSRISATLAAMSRNTSVRPSLREQALKHLVEAAERDGDRNGRMIARAIAIDNNDVLSVRERAIRVYGEDATTTELRDLFGRVQETSLRERAIRMAAAIGDKAAVDWMHIIAMDGNQQMTLRERALRVLGEEMGRGDLLRAAYPTLNEVSLKERVLRAQAEAGGEESRRFLRSVAEDRVAPRALRERALRSLGEQGDLAYLRTIYPKLDDRSLRDRVMRIMAEAGESTDWLRSVALDESEDAGLRDRAVRLMAEHGVTSTELASLYDKLEERALRSRIISLLADRGDDAAWTKLEAISRGDNDPDLRRRALRTLQRS